MEKSDYIDNISLGDSNAENEMDEGEVEEILERIYILIKVDFKKTPEIKNPDGRSWMDEKIFADFRDWCSVPEEVVIRLLRSGTFPHATFVSTCAFSYGSA